MGETRTLLSVPLLHLKIIRIEMSVGLIDAVLLTEATEVDNGLAVAMPKQNRSALSLA
jgi:hypothetical protein